MIELDGSGWSPVRLGNLPYGRLRMLRRVVPHETPAISGRRGKKIRATKVAVSCFKSIARKTLLEYPLSRDRDVILCRSCSGDPQEWRTGRS